MRSHALIMCTKCIMCAHILDKIESHTHHSWSQSHHTQVRFFKKRAKTSLFFWLGDLDKNQVQTQFFIWLVCHASFFFLNRPLESV
jgi:hypothetical protein